MRRNNISHGLGILLAERLWGKGKCSPRSHARVHRENRKITFVIFLLSGFIVLFDPPLSHGIFPTAGRNYSTNIIGCTFAWKIFVIYDDTRDSFHLDNRMRFERLLSVSRRRVKLEKKIYRVSQNVRA